MKSSHGLFLYQEFLEIFFNRRSRGLSTLIADLAVFFFPKTDLKIFSKRNLGDRFHIPDLEVFSNIEVYFS